MESAKSKVQKETNAYQASDVEWPFNVISLQTQLFKIFCRLVSLL